MERKQEKLDDKKHLEDEDEEDSDDQQKIEGANEKIDLKTKVKQAAFNKSGVKQNTPQKKQALSQTQVKKSAVKIPKKKAETTLVGTGISTDESRKLVILERLNNNPGSISENI